MIPLPDHVKPLETRNISTVTRANGIVTTLGQGRFETVTFSTPCRHGAPTEMEVICRLPLIDGHEEARNRAIALVDSAHEGDQTNRADYSTEYATAVCDAETAFWSDPKHLLYIDEAMIKLIYATAAEDILVGNDITVVRRWNSVALRFREQLKGCSTAHDLNVSIGQEVYAARTDQGLKIALSKSIPCSCLAEQSAAAKAEPKAGMCQYCRKQDTQAKLLRCSRCELAFYCSKDCQRKDWKARHKAFCDFVQEER
jgi:hypothetical protein